MNDFCSRSYCHRYLDMFQHFHHMLVLSVRRMRLAGGVFPSLCSFISALVGGNKVPLEARLKRFRRACKLAIKTGCDKLAIKMDIQRIYAGASFVNSYLLPHIAAVFVSSRWLPKAVSLLANSRLLMQDCASFTTLHLLAHASTLFANSNLYAALWCIACVLF